jgi:O-methyltransferase
MNIGEGQTHDHAGEKVAVSRTNWAKSVAKQCLGRFFPRSSRLHTLNLLADLSKWGRQHKVRHCGDMKLDVDEWVHNELIGGAPITYLEFGVHKGNSIKYWCKLNKHEESRFYGFDSFEGFPIEWDKFFGSMKRDHFDVGGQLPLTDDPRCRFIKGWFQNTLDGFLANFQPHGQLVVNCDADLYESCLYVLTRLDQWLKPGVIVFLDDFSSVRNDFTALHDYCRAYMRGYEVLGSGGPYYNRVAIRMTAPN